MRKRHGENQILLMAIVAVVCCGTARTTAQSFDVVSIKPNQSGSRTRSSDELPGGRFVAVNVSLRDLILGAYKLQDFQLSGGPNWIETDRFDVQAKADRATHADEMRLMLQALLAERFKLKLHKDVKESPIYALTTARNDGRMGDRLVSTTVDCAALRDTALRSATGAPPAQCGAQVTPGVIMARGLTIDAFSTLLGPFLGRPVRNQTGLEGTFDLQLRWTPESSSRPATDDRPSLSTAVQEQLGLKLEAQKGPVDVVVIDAASRPSID